MKSKKNPVVKGEDIVESGMSDVLIGAFNRYAKEVITDRAIPDVRDGLKPVQRRIIFDMFSQGQLYNKPTVKCATIVGHVMGHLHPHGDASIYDALVHLSQSWKMEAPLVDFQGNNGSIDDDPAAAYRYTEARLSALSEYLCKDLDKDTVRMVPTFDDKSLEPTVLPSRFPNLLVNGTSGIAVGSATYIPTHNLGEVIDATIYRIHHKRAVLNDLLQYIKGPDFPTGGIIDDKEALHEIYETGRGSFYLYCRCHIDEGENEICITEIPYGLVKIDFVASLNKRKETDHLDNIEEIVDESAKDDVNIVIKVKEGANPQDILNYLQSKGALRNTIACNFLAIDKGHPRCMPLMDMIDSFLSHQREVSTKAFQYDLKTDEDRLEIVNGYIKVYSILNEVIEKIKKCSGKEGVKTMLKTDYGFSERQAEAIAMMPLYRLSNTDILALHKEQDDLNADCKRIQDILNDPDKLDATIVDTLKEVRKQFAIARKTTILDEKQAFTSVDPTKLIAKEKCYVALTSDGYAKRTSEKSYQGTLKANKDESDPLCLPKMKPGDRLVFMRQADTHQALLLFTSLGNYAYVPIHMLSELKWKEEGKHLNNLVSLKPNEKIIKAFLVDTFKAGLNVALLTKENKIKRTALSEFTQNALTRRPLRACKLINKDDALVDAAITTGNSDLIVVDALGRASRFNEADVPLVSTSALGVKAIASGLDNAPLVSLLALSSKEVSLMLVLGDRRAARLISSSQIETTERLSAKTPLIKVLKKNPWHIVSVSKVEKIRGETNYVAITSPETTIALDLGALTPVETGSEMRENVPSLGKSILLGRNFSGEEIKEDALVETPRAAKVIATKAKTDDADTQLSLFDLFEKDKNSGNK
ncbi:MAG: DNA topoisomerase (ATP-hydrolyzing) subunit A [Eubacteriales bacterium]|nr:DNA topoisomerase (ATP-hydrolyzing) subunit A [Eubacteriales bacterium]